MRQIPEDNLAYPVNIILSNGGTGSAFFLNAVTTNYLCTAKHVLFDMDTDALLSPTGSIVSYSKDFKHRNEIDVDLAQLQANGDILFHPTHDVAIVKFSHRDNADSDQSQLGSEYTVKSIKDVVTVNSLNTLKLFADIFIANDVFLLGYPNSLGIAHTPQLDYTRPLLRKGIVAGKNEHSQTIVIDCPTYPGNSGGPVFELENLLDKGQLGYDINLIGVVTQFVPWAHGMAGDQSVENSGYGIVEPVDFIMELVEEHRIKGV